MSEREVGSQFAGLLVEASQLPLSGGPSTKLQTRALNQKPGTRVSSELSR